MNTEDSNKKEYDRIILLNDEELLSDFEFVIQRGAGEGYLYRDWMRKEILKRIKTDKKYNIHMRKCQL